MALSVSCVPLFPANSNDRFHQAYATFNIPLSENLIPKFEYRYERYGRADFQIDRIDPFMAPIDSGADRSIFLGAGVTPYTLISSPPPSSTFSSRLGRF